jgi:hypothetical protein
MSYKQISSSIFPRPGFYLDLQPPQAVVGNIGAITYLHLVKCL